ncbi:MAG TPA: hypothetical protein VD886_12680 [Herpetosiphonaceae bacterium]|nr:hypothetical protein [Herpetosiphonaceae bacterium]
MAKKKKKSENDSLAQSGLRLLLGQVALARVQAERHRDNFNELRPWWPLLIPFLLWRGKKAYDKEYREAVAQPQSKG